MGIKSEFFSAHFATFIVAGAIAAAANFASRILFSLWLSYPSAIVCAYMVGLMTAFVLNRVFVFDATRGVIHRQAFFFVLINIFALTQTLIVSLLLAEWLLPILGVRRWAPEIAHFVGVTAPMFSSYIGHKYWSFGHRR